MSVKFNRILPKATRAKLSFVHWAQTPFAYLDNVRHFEKILRVPLKFDESNAPIFILGHFRSGTTYLHNIMAQNPSVLYPTLLSNLNPESYISGHKTLKQLWLSAFPAFWATGTRGFDNVKLSLDSPAEDEIVSEIPLGTLWHYNSKYHMADLSGGEWERIYCKRLKKLLYYNQLQKNNNMFKSNPRLILKAPSHCLKVPSLLDLFPNAKFIHIHRNPMDVIQSYVHLLKYDDGIDDSDESGEYFDQAIDTYTHLMKTLMTDLDENKVFQDKQNQFAEIKYDDLMSNPIKALEKVFTDLNVNDLMCSEMKDYVEEQQKSHTRKQYKALSESERKRIETELGFAFGRWGYDDINNRTIINGGSGGNNGNDNGQEMSQNDGIEVLQSSSQFYFHN